MGSRGPVPDPSSARSKDGRNTRSRGLRTPAGDVSMPDELLGNARASEHWQRHAPALVEAGRLHPEQAAAFALLCELWADIRRYGDLLLAEGDIIATDKGQAPHPASRLLRDARRDYVALARDFGLTAASDARLPTDGPDGEEDDEAAALRAFTG